MAIRTNAAAVIGVLQDDYGPAEDGSLPSLTPYMASASVIVDRVVTCAANKGITLDANEQEIIERWLSAWAYGESDKPYTQRTTEGASGSFAGQTGEGFCSNLYGQTACRLDWSGCLFNLDKQQRAGAAWLGKPPSQQIPYCERD